MIEGAKKKTYIYFFLINFSFESTNDIFQNELGSLLECQILLFPHGFKNTLSITNENHLKYHTKLMILFQL